MTKNIKFVITIFVFFKLNMHQNPFSAEAPPRTPLGELTTLTQTPSRLGRGIPLPIPLRAQRFRRLELGVVRPPQHKTLATPVTQADVTQRL